MISASINLCDERLDPVAQVLRLDDGSHFIALDFCPGASVILPGIGTQAAECARAIAEVLLVAAAEIEVKCGEPADAR